MRETAGDATFVPVATEVEPSIVATGAVGATGADG